MHCLKLTLNATHEAIDWVRTLLSTENYISDIEIAVYPQSDLHQDEGQLWAFTISFYIPDDALANSRVDKIDRSLSSLQRTGLISELQISSVTEKRLTADSFIHRIGERFVVLSPDVAYQPESTNEIIIQLQKTLSFGSGFHPATMLNLQLLEQYIKPGMSALDLGSGSGILSVAIAKLGAQVLALDNDPIAVQATRDAAMQNQVEHQVTVVEDSLGKGSEMGHWMGLDRLNQVSAIQPSTAFDLITANILGRMHIALAQDYQSALHHKRGSSGLLITSGFTTDYENDINTAFQDVGFEPIHCVRSNEWVALAHRLKT